jgi:amphi-Trp domain-containing protein
MDEPQQDATLPGADLPETADPEQCDGDVIGPESDDEVRDELEAVEVEVEQTLSRTKLISRLKAIVLELEGGSLEIGGVPLAELGNEIEFGIEYSEKGGKHELEIELEW